MTSDLNGDNLIIRCREINEMAQQARELLLPTLRLVSGQQALYNFKNRVKTSKAIWSKVHRKRAEKEYGPSKVADAWGCRYITLFEEQQLAVIRDLFERLEKFCEQTNVPVSLQNASTYYTPTPLGSDQRAAELKSLLRDSNFCPRVIADRSVIREPEMRKGYSSAHFIFEVPLIMDFPRGAVPSPISLKYPEKLKFEVQVRDVFEEAWSEAEHFLFYSRKDDFSPADEEFQRNVDNLKEGIDVIRGSIDVTRNYITTIKRQLDRIQQKNAPNLSESSITLRHDDKMAILAVLKNKVSKDTLDNLSQAYDDLTLAEKCSTGAEARRLYAAAANKLETVKRGLGTASKTAVPGRNGMPVDYFIDGELASSYQFSEQEQKLNAAIELYKGIKLRHPKDPSVRLRLASAIVSLKDEHQKNLTNALELLEEVPHLAANDPLTGPDHWLSLGAGVLKGYVHYDQSCIADKVGDMARRVDELKRAISSTRGGLLAWDKTKNVEGKSQVERTFARKAIGNIIYYTTILLNFGISEPDINKDALRNEINKFDSIKVDPYQDSYKDDHTLMRAYVLLGELEKALDYARNIYQSLVGYAESRAGGALEFHQIVGHLEEGQTGERICFKDAMNVIFSGGTSWA